MRPQSAKAKGRRLCAALKEELLKILPLEPDDLQVTSSGAGGEDLKLSPRARGILPFVFEAKNQEALNIWAAFKQAESHWEKHHTKEDLYPALVFKRNHSEMMIAMTLEDFLHWSFERKRHVFPKKEDFDFSGTHLP